MKINHSILLMSLILTTHVSLINCSEKNLSTGYPDALVPYRYERPELYNKICFWILWEFREIHNSGSDYFENEQARLKEWIQTKHVKAVGTKPPLQIVVDTE